MSKYPQSPETCVAAWIEYNRTEEGLRKKTLKGYSDRIKVVNSIMADNEKETLPYCWTKDDAKWFVDFCLNDRGLKVKTALGYYFVMSAISRFYDNLAVAKAPIHWPYDTTTTRTWLELAEAIKVASWPMTEKQNVGISLMLTMGRRRCENIRADVDDFHIGEKEQYMTVKGKGSKIFNMPFAPNFEKKLTDYLDNYRWPLILEACNDNVKKAEAVKPLIISKHGRNYGRYDEIKGSGYDDAITNAVSIDCGIHFKNHDLRRTFGRELYYTSKVDIVTIKNYYGHSSIDDTLWYIGADQRRMAEEIQKIPFG